MATGGEKGKQANRFECVYERLALKNNEGEANGISGRSVDSVIYSSDDGTVEINNIVN